MNFAFLYDEDTDEWSLSPAYDLTYDLTYSTTYFGEHTTSVDGEGAAPGRKHLLAVGTAVGIRRGKCLDMMAEVEENVREMLGVSG